jgi:hypothetical protein
MPKLKDSDMFAALNKKTFHAKWEHIDFGLLAGMPYTTIRFEDKQAAEDWFKLSRQFLRGLLERMDTFIEENDKQHWNKLRYTNEELK